MAPRNTDREGKTQTLIAHATALFAQNGYSATTIDAVAERAGVAKGTIYQYFKSKQDLFFACFHTYMDHYFTALREQVPSDGISAEEQIRQATGKAFELAEEIGELFPLLFEFWAASASSEMRVRFMKMFRKLYSTFREFFSGMIRRGIDRGELDPDIDVDAVSAVLVGSLDGLLLQTWFDDEMDAVKAGDAFMTIFLRGLKLREPKARHGGAHA